MRFLNNFTQLLRADKEKIKPQSQRLHITEIKDKIKKQVKHCDAIIISDYKKGLVTRELVKEIVKLAIQHRFRIFQTILLNLLIPPIEVLILGLIFVILNDSESSGMLDTITKYTPALLTGLTRHSYVLILCIATLLVIFTWALLRLYRARIIAITRYDIYASQANLVMNLYLNITGKAMSPLSMQNKLWNSSKRQLKLMQTMPGLMHGGPVPWQITEDGTRMNPGKAFWISVLLQ